MIHESRIGYENKNYFHSENIEKLMRLDDHFVL